MPFSPEVRLDAQSLVGKEYKVLDRLGAGGMATVYRAEDLRLHRHVAIKILSAHLADDEEARKRFLREASALARLNHPHVVQIYTCSRPEDPEPFLVTELVEGQSLYEKLGTRPVLPWEVAVAVSVQVLRGLACIHQAGILHRDLKPANILLTSDGVPKIADLGVARVTGATAITTGTGYSGTFPYMPPEAFEAAEVGVAWDIYGMGCILYEMIAGHRAFAAPAVSELIWKIMQGAYLRLDSSASAPWPGLSPLIDRAMDVSATRRFPSADAMRQALEATLNQVGLQDPGALTREFFGAAAAETCVVSLRQKELETLVEHSRMLHKTGRDLEVLEILDRILWIDPAHPVADELTGPKTAAGASGPAGGASLDAPRADAVGVVSSSEPSSAFQIGPWIRALAWAHLGAGLFLAAICMLDLIQVGARALAPGFALESILVWRGLRRRGPREPAAAALIVHWFFTFAFSGRVATSLVIVVSLGHPVLVQSVGVGWVATGVVALAILAFAVKPVPSPRWALFGGSALGIAAALFFAVVLQSALVAREHRLQTDILTVNPQSRPPALILDTGLTLGVDSASCLVTLPWPAHKVVAALGNAHLDGMAVHVATTASGPQALAKGGLADPAGGRIELKGEALAVVNALHAAGGRRMLLQSTDDDTKRSGRLDLELFDRLQRVLLARWTETLDADVVELLGDPDTIAKLATFDASSVQDLAHWERLLMGQASALKSRFPHLSVGVSLTLKPVDETSNSRGLAMLERMADQPMIDWVGVRVLVPPPPIVGIDRLRDALSRAGQTPKLWLFTSMSLIEDTRANWQMDEDTAWNALIARLARSRGLSVWVHGKGVSFLTYGNVTADHDPAWFLDRCTSFALLARRSLPPSESKTSP